MTNGKSILIIIALLTLPFTFYGQSNEKGDVEIRGGLGAPNFPGFILNSMPDGKFSGENSVPFGINLRYYFSPKFSLGLQFGHVEASSDHYMLTLNINDSTNISGLVRADLRRTTIAIRPDLHLGNSQKWDHYIGGFLGMRASKLKFVAEVSEVNAEYLTKFFDELGLSFLGVDLLDILDYFGYDKFKFSYPFYTPAIGLHFGTRYSITENIGIYGEIGGGMFLVNGGVSMKF